MDVTQVNYYGACDEAIRQMNRENLKAFGRLKAAKFDELNVIREVRQMYRQSADRARKRYKKVAFDAYMMMCGLCGIEEAEARKMAEKAITDEWLRNTLAETDFVTLYRFDSETERKAMRLAEALEVPDKRGEEIDKALRLWSRQLGQFAINITDYAMVMAMQDAGAEAAQWVTMKDERVCVECSWLDGQIFLIDEIPPKPHPGCRCRLRPVMKYEAE